MRALRMSARANAMRWLNPDEHPTLVEKDGQLFYKVELRRVGAGDGKEEVDLHIAPDGTFLGRDRAGPGAGG